MISLISGRGLFAGLHQRVQLSVDFCGGESKGKLSNIHIYQLGVLCWAPFKIQASIVQLIYLQICGASLTHGNVSVCPADASVTTQSNRESCDGQAYQKPPSVRENCEWLSFPVGQKLTAALHHAPFIFPEGLSSIETLLTNIQVRLYQLYHYDPPAGTGRETNDSLGFPKIVE